MENLVISFNTLPYILGPSILMLLGYALRLESVNGLFGTWTSKSILRWGNASTAEDIKVQETPDDLGHSPSWWSDEQLFELERRAIFSKTWLFVTHASRFQKPGDYRTFEIAGFSFFIILGKDKELRSFHNVCRHRAYAVTKKESGSSTVLGCRYHGWSYDMKGKLLKAPEFDKVPGFDKESNGLWEIKTSVSQFMVFVNFDAAAHVESLSLGDAEPRLWNWNMAKMQCVEEWKVDGTFNWKLLGSLALKEEKQRKLWSLTWPLLVRTGQEDLEIGHTTIIRRVSSGIVVILKGVPKSAKLTTVQCSIYAKKAEAAIEMASLKSDINWEIKQLASKQQRILRNQEPIMSLAISAANQGEINRLLGVHVQAEKKARGEIHPAAREQSFSREGKADDDFCRKLEKPGSTCSANSKGLLDW